MGDSTGIVYKPQFHLIQLAPMECIASCVMTALGMKGQVPEWYLLDYWNINYFFKVLVSSKKSMNLKNLKTIYGVEVAFRKTTPEELTHRFAAGGLALLDCKASRLPFFPSSMLSYDDSGFTHSILLCGFREEDRCFLVADPVAGYEGWVPEEVLLQAGVYKGQLYVHMLHFSEPTPTHTHQELFRYAARNNRDYFETEDTRSGRNALLSFTRDIGVLLQDNPSRLPEWIGQNILTVTSIITMRKKVWEALKRLNVIPEEDEQGVSALFDDIVKQWTRFNYLLVKLKINPSSDLLASLMAKNEDIVQSERTFLYRLSELGGK